MAIAATNMSSQDDRENSNNYDNTKDDDHEHDLVMPGFRFHPTEEELIEFYLRRKVEGKRFSVELITFLDLYRYDPWELPAMASIGEKEWFFYVPRDRKYRNGDRPNRVTTSGYWKATGADRMIRSENFKSIGLKKTLVFYSGKAPKGIRSSWIMNEYRLPHQETERLQKAEISLCRVYKRPGVEDHPSLPRSLPTTRASSSRKQHAAETSTQAAAEKPFQAFGGSNPQALEEGGEKMSETSASSSTEIGMSSLGSFPKHMNPYMNALPSIPSPIAPPPLTPMEGCSNILVPQNASIAQVDDLQRLISFHQQASMSAQQQQEFYHLYHHPSNFPTMFQPQVPLNNSDRLWEWNTIAEGNKDCFSTPFK
ncbi:hypothetical protein RHMOL_Rhmol11G0175900 [Rhododendron molle]|uniref:Uncharacterized protein n=1 Tax=Rhododendron molle TaxID=49168 RepID=A0ACC0LT52_RHOML|nr:hypothetical protein RHMOL_Rhmol11G0175900 [Rhododendron molle]